MPRRTPPLPPRPSPDAGELASLPTEEVGACLLDPGTAGRPDPAADRALGLPPDFGVLACPDCGLRWLSPRPTAEGYRRLYSEDCYFGDEVEDVEPYRRVVARRLWGFRRRLGCLERLFAGHRDPTVPGGDWRPRLRVLDVGAATGDFVVEARRRGHRADGFEVSADARREARERHGVELAGGALEDLAGPYDVVHLNHVLEHLPDPLATLGTVARLAAPDGALVVEVPQQFNNAVEPLLRLAGRSRHGRFGVHSLHHTYFFTPTTLGATLEAGGFRLQRCRTFHWGITPPVPFSPSRWLLGGYLWLVDRLFAGGPVIEALARPARFGSGGGDGG